MKPEKGRQDIGAIEIIEEAVHLLRLSPAIILFTYYIGSLPFMLGLLYFWADMSKSAFAIQRCAAASFCLAMLFVWMKCWQAVFTSRLKARISHDHPPHWPFVRIVHLAATQTLIQASGFLLLPLSLLMTAPFGWSYAFYQNVSAQGDGDDLGTICKKSWEQAKLWPVQNHLLLLVFSIFGTFVFLNVALSIFLLPHMLKRLLGVDNIFAMSGLTLLNTTFLTTTIGITYLCLDPLIKTVYALRCYYGSSLNTGHDIKTELRLFLPQGMGLATILIVLLGTGSFSPLIGDEGPDASRIEYRLQDVGVLPEELDHSIAEVVNQRKFAWRMPRKKASVETGNQPRSISALMEWITQGCRACATAIRRWIGAIVGWLEELLPGTDRDRETSSTGWMNSVQGIILFFLFVLGCTLCILLRRILRVRKKRYLVRAGEVTPSIPDPTDEEVKADELPTIRWLALAKELTEKGLLRAAVRAFYLATLSYLAEHNMITIAKYKSNHDYERELSRRAHEKKVLLAAFSGNVATFDRVWYGMHEITPNDVDIFAADQDRIMALV